MFPTTYYTLSSSHFYCIPLLRSHFFLLCLTNPLLYPSLFPVLLPTRFYTHRYSQSCSLPPFYTPPSSKVLLRTPSFTPSHLIYTSYPLFLPFILSILLPTPYYSLLSILLPTPYYSLLSILLPTPYYSLLSILLPTPFYSLFSILLPTPYSLLSPSAVL